MSRCYECDNEICTCHGDPLAEIELERDKYRDALDSLKMQAIEKMPTDEWVAIPAVEWEQVFRGIGWSA